VDSSSDPPDETEHDATFRMFSNKNLEGMPVGRESCHRDER